MTTKQFLDSSCRSMLQEVTDQIEKENILNNIAKIEQRCYRTAV
jgi:hypothetical protein